MCSNRDSHVSYGIHRTHLVIALSDDMEESGLSADEAVERVASDCRPYGWIPSLVFGLPSEPVVVLERAEASEPPALLSQG